MKQQGDNLDVHDLAQKYFSPISPGDSENVLQAEQIKTFQDRILNFYRDHGRNLPWRKTEESYHIYVSEVMLQQTQVSRVVTKYPEFIRQFPDFNSLAAARLEEVLAVWKGMGYNRRAKFLKASAVMVVEKFRGILPDSVADLQSLPGIGPATARSIYVFAFNKPEVFIETNIRRVYIQTFFPEDETVEDAALIPLVEKTLFRENPARWYNALMDYGVFLAKAFGNANKRSKSYSVQPKFEGSIRQVRGAILSLLLDQRELSRSDLLSALPFDKDSDEERKTAALDGLLQEKMVTESEGIISLSRE